MVRVLYIKESCMWLYIDTGMNTIEPPDNGSFDVKDCSEKGQRESAIISCIMEICWLWLALHLQ